MSNFISIRSKKTHGILFLRDIGQYISQRATISLPTEKVLKSDSCREALEHGDVVIFYEHKPHTLITVNDFKNYKGAPISTPKISTPMKEDSSILKELQKFASSILGSISELKEEVKNIKATTIIQGSQISSQNGSQISTPIEHDYNIVLDQNLNITSNLDNAVKQVESTANDMGALMDALMKNKKG